MTTQTLGRYTLLEHLGSGNVTETFRASVTGIEGFEKSVALKRVLAPFQDDPSLIDSFVSTLRPSVALCHANITQVLDLVAPDSGIAGQYWITQYVEGWPLSLLLTRSRALGLAVPLPLIVHLGLETTKALDYAHRLQPDDPIVHGNVSASNLLISREGEIKLADFGVTQALIQRNAILGLPAHEGMDSTLSSLSPEQLFAGAATPQSDLYSLAATLRECLATPRSLPIDLANGGEAPALRELRDDLPASVDAALQAALALDPEQRTQTAEELHEALLEAVMTSRLRWSRADTIAWLTQTLTAQPEPAPAPEPSASIPVEVSLPVELSLLLLSSTSDVPEPTRARAEALLTRSAQAVKWLSPTQLCAVFLQNDGRDAEQAVRSALCLMRTLDIAAKATDIAIDLGSVEESELNATPGDIPQSALDAALQLNGPEWHSPGRVVVSQRATRELRSLFRLKRLNQLHFALVGSRSLEQASGPFLGRQNELNWLLQRLQHMDTATQLPPLAVSGAVGLGKTRLLLELGQPARERVPGIKLCVASAPVRGEQVPYSGVAALLSRLCEIRDGDSMPQPVRHGHALTHVALNDVQHVQEVLAGAPSPGEQSDTELRDLLLRIVHARINKGPHLLVLDGAHCLDSHSSRVLGPQFSERLGPGVCFVVLSRNEATAGALGIAAPDRLVLEPLDPGTMREIIATRLNVAEAPEELAAHFAGRAQGNPFVLEELLREALAQGQITLGRSQIRTFDANLPLQLPRSLRILQQNQE